MPNDDLESTSGVRLLGLQAKLIFPGYPAMDIDLSDSECPEVAQMLLASLHEKSAIGGQLSTPGSVRVYLSKMRLFIGYLSEHWSPSISLTELSREHLDAFEEWLRAERGSETNYVAVSVLQIVVLLKMAESIGYALNPDLRSRLRWNINGPWGKGKTHEPYSGAEWQAIRAAAATAQRTVVRSRHELSKEVWTGLRQALYEEVLTQGRLAGDGFERASECGGASRIYQKAFVLRQELLPFILRLAVETGWEPDVIRNLKSDCLVNPSGGTIGVSTFKRRRHGMEHREVRVKDGNLSTPGGIIRAVLTLTDSARQAIKADGLWVGYKQFGGVGPFKFATTHGLFARLVEEHDLRDDSGNPLSLNLVRVRKTYKSLQYRALNGDMDQFPQGHSRDISARHYAQVSFNAGLHEQTIVDGILDFANTVTEPPPPPAESSSAPRAEDTWLSSCRDIYSSPYAPEGKPCQAVPWMCLACPNSVSSPHKLPAQLAFMRLAHIQRQSLPAASWHARYGTAWKHLVFEILPRFTPLEIEEAKTIAGYDPASSFLNIAMGVEE